MARLEDVHDGPEFGSPSERELGDVPVHSQEQIQVAKKMRNASFDGLRMIATCWQAWFRLGG